MSDATSCWARTGLVAAIGAVPCATFFEVDRRFIALAALKALADEGTIPAVEVSAALRKLEIDPEKADPTRV